MGNQFDEDAYKAGKQSTRTLGNVGGALWVGLLGGSANTYTATITGLEAYAAGQCFFVKVPAATTGASTLNINGLGTKAIQVAGAATTTNVVTAATYLAVYDGTAFQFIA